MHGGWHDAVIAQRVRPVCPDRIQSEQPGVLRHRGSMATRRETVGVVAIFARAHDDLEGHAPVARDSGSARRRWSSRERVAGFGSVGLVPAADFR